MQLTNSFKAPTTRSVGRLELPVQAERVLDGLESDCHRVAAAVDETKGRVLARLTETGSGSAYTTTSSLQLDRRHSPVQFRSLCTTPPSLLSHQRTSPTPCPIPNNRQPEWESRWTWMS